MGQRWVSGGSQRIGDWPLAVYILPRDDQTGNWGDWTILQDSDTDKADEHQPVERSGHLDLSPGWELMFNLR